MKKLVLLGDSIRLFGYGTVIQELLPEYEIYQPEENCRFAKYLLRLLFELNEFIANHKADGMLDEMYDYWIKGFDANTSVCKEVTYTGENGELRVGVEGAYEPFSFVSFGKDSGFDIDFVQRFCAEYGYVP